MSFFQAIVNIVGEVWKLINSLGPKFINWISEFYKLYSWSVGVFLGLLWFSLVYIHDTIVWLGENLPALLNQLEQGSGIVGQQAAGPLSTGFAIANAILPLTEAFGFVVAIGPIWMLAVTIRVIKSWIPTVN